MEDGVVYDYYTPFFGNTSGTRTGGWVFPFWSREKDLGFDEKLAILEKDHLPKDIRIRKKEGRLDADLFRKKKHEFLIDNGVIYKNGKERKNIGKMSLYKYKKYLLIVFNGGEFYLIPNNAFIEGSRSEFLSLIQFTGIHSFIFKDKM